MEMWKDFEQKYLPVFDTYLKYKLSLRDGSGNAVRGT